jgi:hypothetical protein
MNKEEAIEKIKEGASLSEIDAEFRKDRDVVMLALEANGNELEYASEEMQRDRDIALASIRASEGYPFEYISIELWDDATFVEDALEVSSECFGFVSKRLLSDKIYVLELMNKYDIPIHALSDELRDDANVFLLAYKSSLNDRGDFNFASNRLKSIESFMIDAIKINPESIYYANEKLFESEDFVKMCLEINPETAEYNLPISFYKEIKHGNINFDYKDPNWKKYHSIMALVSGTWDHELFNHLDFETILQALENGAKIDAQILFNNLFNQEIHHDYGVGLALLKRQGLLLEHLKDLQNNYDAVMAAVKNDGIAYRFASPELRKNIQVSKEAVLNNLAAIDYISKEVRSSDEFIEFMKKNYPDFDFMKNTI